MLDTITDMKVQQLNNDVLLISKGATGTIIISIALLLIGVGAGVAPLITSGLEWWVHLIGAGLFIVGLVLLFTASKEVVTLRLTGESTVERTRVLSKKTTKESFQREQVAAIGLETVTSYERTSTTDSQGDGIGGVSQPGNMRRVRRSVLYVQLTDNSQVIIGQAQSTNGTTIAGVDVSAFGKAPLFKEAQQIATFFGVPLTGSNIDPTGVQNIQDAINVVHENIVGTPGVLQANAVPTTQPAAQVQPATQPQPTLRQLQPQPQPQTIVSAPEAQVSSSAPSGSQDGGIPSLQ
jgi:hypothetical protein